MPASASPVLPLPLTLTPAHAGARHLHLVLPYAALPDNSCQHTLQTLELPQLDQLLSLLSPTTTDTVPDHALLPTHERALAQLWGLDPQAPAWAALAQPQPLEQPCAWMTLCHWTAGADQVRMDDPSTLPLDMDDAQALHAVLQPWFAEDGMQLHVVEPGRWLVSGPALQDLHTASLDCVLLQDVSRWLPQGPHARQLQRLHSEVQMLLYNHAFNTQRAQRGLPAINAFWLHGAGPLSADAWHAARTLQKAAPVRLVDSLRQAALRQDWLAWKAAWLAADAGPIAQVLAHVQLGGTATLTFCGTQQLRSFTTLRRNIWQKIHNYIRPQRFADIYPAL